jgi:hypothetical protein
MQLFCISSIFFKSEKAKTKTKKSAKEESRLSPGEKKPGTLAGRLHSIIITRLLS